MRTWNQPSGLSAGLAFTVDAHWTPEQALVVWDLLDDLRERVWSHYGLAIQNLLHERHHTSDPFGDNEDMTF